jgi:hypothetical protein
MKSELLSMFKSWSGGMEAGARLVGGGRPGVAGNPVGTGEETRSSVTFNVPQAERAKVVINNSQRIFLIISRSGEKGGRSLPRKCINSNRVVKTLTTKGTKKHKGKKKHFSVLFVSFRGKYA